MGEYFRMQWFTSVIKASWLQGIPVHLVSPWQIYMARSYTPFHLYNCLSWQSARMFSPTMCISGSNPMGIELYQTRGMQQQLYRTQSVQPGSPPTTTEFLAPWLAETYAIKWHMGHYEAHTPKPSRGWCNNQMFQHLNCGKYHHNSTKKGGKAAAKVQTVKKSISKTGKVSYSGTRALKQTQYTP